MKSNPEKQLAVKKTFLEFPTCKRMLERATDCRIEFPTTTLPSRILKQVKLAAVLIRVDARMVMLEPPFKFINSTALDPVVARYVLTISTCAE